MSYCYVAIGADLSRKLDTTYFVKIGKAKEPEKRTFSQRIELVAFAPNDPIMGRVMLGGNDIGPCISYKSLEFFLISKAQEKWGVNEIARGAGWTEMVGNFLYPYEALDAAEIIISMIHERGDREIYRWNADEYEWCAT